MRYEVFVNGTLLYDSFLVNEKELRILSPVLTVNEEGGSFTFTLPKSHILWNTLASHFGNSDAYILFTRKTDTIVINRDGKWLWEGYISNFEEDLDGSYSITCSGALTYLKNVRYPLAVVLDRIRGANETRASHFENAFRRLVKTVLRQYNDRLNDFKSLYNIDLSYQKIYYVGGKSRIDIPSNIAVPQQFQRISNYDECYELLDNFASDFGGHFYLTRYYAHTMTASYYGPNDAQGNPKTGDATIDIQDDSITSDVTRDILVINFKADSNVIDNAVVHMGSHLLEYNVSDSFELATSVIPRGAQYSERKDSKSGSHWWLRDNQMVFDDCDHYSTLAWSRGQYRYYYSNRLTPYGGSRVFLSNLSDSDLEIAKKIGMRDVIVDFGDDVVAKFPARQGEVDNDAYGFPFTWSDLSTDIATVQTEAYDSYHPPYCTWKKNHDYKIGDVIYLGTYKSTGTNDSDIIVYAYTCRHDHTSSASTYPLNDEYWDQEGVVGVNHMYAERNVGYSPKPPDFTYGGTTYTYGFYSYDSCLGRNKGSDESSAAKYGPVIYTDSYSINQNGMDFITSWNYYYARRYPMWDYTKTYAAGDMVRYSPSGSNFTYLYQANYPHTNQNPTNTTYWSRIAFSSHPEMRATDWDNIDDYLDAPGIWSTDKDYVSTWWYHEDYTRALRILGKYYLQSQQFDDLELSITSDMIVLDDAISEVNYDPEDDSKADLALWYMHIGDQLPVSANLFGDNLKPYPILEVSFELSDDSSSTITLGKKTSDLTVLIRNKES